MVKQTSGEESQAVHDGGEQPDSRDQRLGQAAPSGAVGRRQRSKAVTMGLLLVGIAVVGPAITHAGVSVIWPASEHTANVDTTPIITFAQGADYAQAESLGFASSFTAVDSGAAFTLTLSGLSGGSVTIDDYVAATVDPAVDTWNMEISSALAGTLTAPTLLKIRLWTGLTAPTADGDAQVCGVLDLTAAVNTATATSCADDAKIQVIYTLPSSSTGSSAVSIRPSSIVFA